MRLVKAVIAYDGTHFKGWQVQKGAGTVQDALHQALERIHGHSVKTVAASRTDGGVHAEGQVVHFVSDSKLTDLKLRIAINYNLPESVAVRTLKTLKGDFHARFDARQKLYRYVIYTARTKPVFDRARVWWLAHKLNVPAMRRAAAFLVGKHDFTSFTAPGRDDRSKVRTIKRLSVVKTGDRIVIEVVGDGFLYNMVRIIVGTLVHVGFGKLSPADVKAALEAKDRRRAGPTAEPRGLTLVKVYYPVRSLSAAKRGKMDVLEKIS